jgi:transposase InsO family protein
MTQTEQNYSAQEREMLAIVHSLKKWRGYIEGSPIVVRTDHESLKYFHTQKNLGRRLTRFHDDISHFDVQIIYRPGRSQVAADALSRREGHEEVLDSDYKPLYAFAAELEEPDRSAIYKTLAKYKQDLLKNIPVGEGKYTVWDNRLYKNISTEAERPQFVLVPTTVDEAYAIVTALHRDLGHLGMNAVTEALRSRAWIPYASELVEEIVRSCDQCQFTKRGLTVSQPLHPLPRVNAADVWAFDFVGPLPKTKKGRQYLLTAMDLGTDYPLAEPLASRSAESVINLNRHIVSTFGKPRAILTDNGEEFRSYAYENFLQRLGIEHLHTSPYHPQTNGRLEKFNDTLVQMLARLSAPDTQDQWDEYLPDALLAHRSHTNPSTKHSPAFMMFGHEARLPHDAVFNLLRVPPSDAEIEQLQHKRLEHVQNLEKFREESNAKALARLEAEAESRDESYKERALGIGDLVLRVNERQSKIHPRWDGPFIIHDVSDKNTYQLRTRNGYILRHLYNGSRLQRYYPGRWADPVPSLWYASSELQRKDAHERMKARNSALKSSERSANTNESTN